ncbi:MAG: hypothetical protein ACOYXT_13100 [Bacteroidota bacterium]
MSFLSKLFNAKKSGNENGRLNDPRHHENLNIHRDIIIGSGAIFIILLVTITALVHVFTGGDFYKSLTVSIIVSWIIVLVVYYAWALYFYNINYGWSEEDWVKYREDKQKNPDLAEKEPERNPHYEETLGLPPGTVRGTVALTLLVGGVAMTIAALSFGDRVKENELLIDNFDFFKKAFLMMIAFYFGAKSLEIMQSEKKTTSEGTLSTTTQQTPSPEPTSERDAEPQELRTPSAATLARRALQEGAPVEAKADFFDPTSKG